MRMQKHFSTYLHLNQISTRRVEGNKHTPQVNIKFYYILIYNFHLNLLEL